jgi:hypothetical protein
MSPNWSRPSRLQPSTNYDVRKLRARVTPEPNLRSGVVAVYELQFARFI